VASMFPPDSQAHGAGALDEQLRALNAQDERLRDLLVGHLDGVGEDVLEDGARKLAGMLHGDAVGDRVARLTDHADHPHTGAAILQRERDAGGEPAAADRDQHGLGVGRLLRELEADRPLAGDHALVLEGVHERRAGALDVRRRGRDGLLEALAGQLGRAAVGASGLDLGHRRVLRHEDRRGDARFPRRPGHRLPVVPRARRDDSGGALALAQGRDRVVRPADLEGAGALEVLRLQEHLTPREAREGLRRVEGRLARDALKTGARGLDVSDCRRHRA
jgi:hypothetical protein